MGVMLSLSVKIVEIMRSITVFAGTVTPKGTKINEPISSSSSSLEREESVSDVFSGFFCTVSVGVAGDDDVG